MSDTPATDAKTLARPASEILADIRKEREGLTSSFETLRGDLDGALDAGRQRSQDAGKKAARIGPIVAGAAVSAVVAALLIRRRFSREK